MVMPGTHTTSIDIDSDVESAESEGSGHSAGSASARPAPDNETEHVVGETRSHPEEIRVVDCSVVVQDREACAHTTPRYWHYTCEAEPLPVP